MLVLLVVAGDRPARVVMLSAPRGALRPLVNQNSFRKMWLNKRSADPRFFEPRKDPWPAAVRSVEDVAFSSGHRGAYARTNP